MQIGIEIIEKGCKRTSYVESSLIDILYEMIKNTYLGYEEIVLPNPIWEFVDNQVLGDFLTYILAYPKNVKTPVVHIQGRMKKIEAQYKSEYAGSPFVCFSGGVDSTEHYYICWIYRRNRLHYGAIMVNLIICLRSRWSKKYAIN